MSRLNQTNSSFIYTSILYVAGLLLFLEWIYPVEQVTDTVYIGIFIIYTFFCFFITALRVKWWLSFLLKGFGIIFILNGIYSEHSMLSKLWYSELTSDVVFNIKAILARQWFDLSNLFRTLLFLVIIWLMSYLIYYWFVQVKRVLVFSILTFVYITLLDTFTVYSADWAIFRTFVIVFLALGIANVLKEVQRENIQVNRLKTGPIWILPLISIVLFSSIVGYAAPKLEPQWPDPVPYLESAVNGNGFGNGKVQKVGYGENDERLGGSFVQDYTPVFKAYMKEKNYFRIESKDYYTGKGWINSEKQRFVEQDANNIEFETFDPVIETEQHDVTLEFDDKTRIPKLIYPYGVRQVQLPSDNIQLKLDNLNGEIKTEVDNKDVYLTNYTMIYDSPTYSREMMRESGPSSNEEFVTMYTRLPATLPERVYDLAEEITSGYTNQYEKVRAIEKYFSRNGFVYQISDVAVPGEEEDYVDQFLFDTKAGYCDNFSTSMVVMLRTLDIPARWVKGFTSGDIIESNINDGEYDVYEVTNANAHSWVEVYFEDVGWVPFEPTQGFNAPTNYAVETSTEDDFLDAPDVAPEVPEQDEIRGEQDKQVEDVFSPSTGDETKFSFTLIHGGILLVIIVLIASILFWKRYEIRTYFMQKKLLKHNDAQAYQDAYHYILKLLSKEGFHKEPDQTLREYALRIDDWYGTTEMGELTSHYEKLIYQRDPSNLFNEEVSNLWKNLIKRILG